MQLFHCLDERNDNMAKQKRRKYVRTITEWCKGCGICVAFCPVKILTLKNEKIVVIDQDKCTNCGLCEMRCPDYAIYLEEQEAEVNG